MVDLMPTWYRLNEEEEIPYVYVWRMAELGKLAYNLQKYKKACEYTEKAFAIMERIKFSNNFIEVKELKERHQEMKIGLSLNKAEIFRKAVN
jgi:ribosomal protein L7Ae-like RNA K-turn-binding protein